MQEVKVPSVTVLVDEDGARRGELRFTSDGYVRFYAYTAAGAVQTQTFAINLANGRFSLFGATPVAQQSDIVALTDNSAGTANNTIEAMANPTDSPATADALRDDIVANLLPAIRNNFADVAAKINSIRTALRNLGLMA